MLTESERKKRAEALQQRIRNRLERIKHRVVVFSGKGGVGKTTIATNLACALVAHGARVGLLDADVTGPNVPKMLGLDERLCMDEDEVMIPSEKHGLKIVSLAMLISPDSPVIWRGPIRSRALDQFLGDVEWGDLDILVADLPPGTGDEVLTMAQRMKPQIAVIVTTPQEMSLIDSRRAINMARKMEIPRIGVVENMSGLPCPHCDRLIEVFGSGGGERMAEQFGVEFLGRVPISLDAREGADRGTPIVLSDERADVSRALLKVADAVVGLVEDPSWHNREPNRETAYQEQPTADRARTRPRRTLPVLHPRQ